MAKVLAYRPDNFNTFIDAPRTVHSDYGCLFEIKLENGLSVKVSEDHSLATSSKTHVFEPLEPALALGRFLPVLMGGYAPEELDVDVFFKALDNREYLPDLLKLDTSSLRTLLAMRDIWDMPWSTEYDKYLRAYIYSAAGFEYKITEDRIVVDKESQGRVPEGDRLVKREDADPINIYRLLPYTWSRVVSAESVEVEPETYDFTVPHYPVFVANCILLYDTMQVHVPVTEEAKREAQEKMFPSKNLFSVRTLEPMMVPQQEHIYGLWKASQKSNEKTMSYTNAGKLREDLKLGIIRPNDPVTMNGNKGTAGIVLANEALPPAYRDFTSLWTKGVVIKLLTKLAKEKPGVYTRAADTLKELGSMYGYLLGCSFKTSDFDLSALKKDRDKFFKNIDEKLKNAKSYDEKVLLLRSAQAYNAGLTPKESGNTFHDWAFSGSKGTPSQVMQIIASPTIVSDPKDRVVPMLIRKSYNEGLSTADYWVSSYGTRKGVVGTKLSVAPAGALNKELIANVLDIVITEKDCGTKRGIEYPIEDAKDVEGRYEAGTNKYIDSHVYEKLLKDKVKHIKVRSPMTCEAAEGVCQMCHGNNEKGHLPEIGNNVGVQAAQALTEPMTQMGLNAKHSAGTAKDDSIGLTEISKFFTMPTQYSGAAVIASTSGVVTKVTPGLAGGTDILIGSKKHHIMPGRDVHVKLGDSVHAGDILSSGVPNIAKIVPHKGIDFGRHLFVNTAHDLYRRAGSPSVKKNFEIVARGMINYVQIDDPGDFDFIEGDTVEYNLLMGEVRKHPDKKPPTFHATQKGSTFSPQQKSDWLGNFGFKYLKRTLLENVATGAKSLLHSYHPISAYVAGKDFGKGEQGRY